MRKRNMALAITVTTMSAALLLVIGPQRIAVATTETGDAELSATLRKHTEAGFNNLTAFTLHDGKATFAGLGTDEHTEVEIGSVTKMFTAELAHQLVEEGKISLDTTVGDVLDVGQAPISEVTVQELLNHTSGLPRLAQGNIFADVIAAVTGANPYAGKQPKISSIPPPKRILKIVEQRLIPIWDMDCSATSWKRLPIHPMKNCSTRGSCNPPEWRRPTS
ncbi:serine hydrolase [Corynebacterium sp. KPL2830]|uniref:serine hydrolase n=1 Tax=Corynebacterium sp. KPL2830 TaxID=3158315 RepID=UPI0032EDB323